MMMVSTATPPKANIAIHAYAATIGVLSRSIMDSTLRTDAWPAHRHASDASYASRRTPCCATISRVSTRWNDADAPRGDEYDARWSQLAAAGQNVHGEADLVEELLRETGGTRVLDAGCGTGRV